MPPKKSSNSKGPKRRSMTGRPQKRMEDNGRRLKNRLDSLVTCLQERQPFPYEGTFFQVRDEQLLVIRDLVSAVASEDLMASMIDYESTADRMETLFNSGDRPEGVSNTGVDSVTPYAASANSGSARCNYAMFRPMDASAIFRGVPGLSDFKTFTIQTVNGIHDSIRIWQNALHCYLLEIERYLRVLSPMVNLRQQCALKDEVNVLLTSPEMCALSHFSSVLAGHQFLPNASRNDPTSHSIADSLLTTDTELDLYFRSVLFFVDFLASIIFPELDTKIGSTKSEIEIASVTNFSVRMYLDTLRLLTGKVIEGTPLEEIDHLLGSTHPDERFKPFLKKCSERYGQHLSGLLRCWKAGYQFELRDFLCPTGIAEDAVKSTYQMCASCTKSRQATTPNSDCARRRCSSSEGTCQSCLYSDFAYLNALVERVETELGTHDGVIRSLVQVFERMRTESTKLKKDDLITLVQNFMCYSGGFIISCQQFRANRTLLTTIVALERLKNESPTLRLPPQFIQEMSRLRCLAMYHLYGITHKALDAVSSSFSQMKIVEQAKTYTLKLLVRFHGQIEEWREKLIELREAIRDRMA